MSDRDSADWWRHAVIYQVYPRSFADANGDGMGDLAGLRERLPYIRDLGVDAVWINPWYPSPMADAGYDVADYRDVDPVFGTLADADDLIAATHDAGLRILLDIVPNHTSSAHPWFQAALRAGPGSADRSRYLFRPGRNGGAEPPNDWQSVFGGSAWTRLTEANGSLGEWYLHLFDVEQPDLNWDSAEVRAEFESILHFWFDRGVDGFRIDVANSLFKHPELPDLGDRGIHSYEVAPGDDHPFWDRDVVHAVYRDWRRIANAYDPPRVFVAEAWVPTVERLARYVRPEQLHSAFNFHFLLTPWRAALLRAAIDESWEALSAVGANPTWVLSNHDVVRAVTRLGRPQPEVRQWLDDSDLTDVPDLELGTRRARAAALLMLALPGGAYVYQGEELGLWEVLDLPAELLQDPTWERSGRTRRGRDGARVPIPWSRSGLSLGFGPAHGARPWLPQPAAWSDLSVEAQSGSPGSMLELYRSALRIRREHAGFDVGRLTWRDAPVGILLFGRGDGLTVMVNFDADDAALPEHRKVLLASAQLDGRQVPRDTTVWLAE
jgi:alpha-glucosidase